jgi:CheY-like chemotaxis protein
LLVDDDKDHLKLFSIILEQQGHSVEVYADPISGCFKTIGETNVGTGDTQNWTENIQNFVSLIPTDNTISLINKYITQLGGSGPITDMAGIWDVLTNGNMTAHDRKMVLTDVNSLLAAAQPGITQIQQDALSRCITNETNSLGPTPSY